MNSNADQNVKISNPEDPNYEEYAEPDMDHKGPMVDILIIVFNNYFWGNPFPFPKVWALLKKKLEFNFWWFLP